MGDVLFSIPYCLGTYSGERVHLGWRRLVYRNQAEKINIIDIVKVGLLNIMSFGCTSCMRNSFGILDQQFVIETCASSLHGYWSSSENNNNNAWNQRFSDGNQNNNNKNNTLSVRCVRSWKLFLERLFPLASSL